MSRIARTCMHEKYIMYNAAKSVRMCVHIYIPNVCVYMMVAEKFLRAKRMDEHPRAPDEQWKRRRAC